MLWWKKSNSDEFGCFSKNRICFMLLLVWILGVIAWKGSKPIVLDDFKLFHSGFVNLEDSGFILNSLICFLKWNAVMLFNNMLSKHFHLFDSLWLSSSEKLENVSKTVKCDSTMQKKSLIEFFKTLEDNNEWCCS